MQRPDIIFRTLVLIESVTDDRRRLKHLEEETGIPDRQWKQVWALKQRPTAYMLEALGRRWPEHAFWLLTGIEDPENGHISPERNPRATAEDKEAVDLARDAFDLQILTEEMRSPESWDLHIRRRKGKAWQDLQTERPPMDESLKSVADFIEEQSSDSYDDAQLVDELWLRFLRAQQKQDDTKELDQAIARIAQAKRVRTLLERFGFKTPDPSPIDLVMKVMSAFQARVLRYRRQDEAAQAGRPARPRAK